MSVLSKFASEDLDDDVFTGLSPLQELMARAEKMNGEKALEKAKGEKMDKFYRPMTEEERLLRYYQEPPMSREDVLRASAAYQRENYVPFRGLRDAYNSGMNYLSGIRQNGEDWIRSSGMLGDNPYMYGDVINDEGRKRYGWH